MRPRTAACSTGRHRVPNHMTQTPTDPQDPQAFPENDPIEPGHEPGPGAEPSPDERRPR